LAKKFDGIHVSLKRECKHEILLTSAEFTQGLAAASCTDRGRGAVAIEEMFLDG